MPVPYLLPTEHSSASTVFNIDLISCSANTAYDYIFINAAQKWMSLIVGDVPDENNGGVPLEDCIKHPNGTLLARCNSVDDLVIGWFDLPGFSFCPPWLAC